MEQNVTVNNNGMGCLGVVQILFIIFKVFGFIDWSWFVVLIPTWICIALVIVAVILAIIAIIVKDE